MEIVEVARIDVARSLCSKEEKDMRAHWWHLGVPLSVFAGLHVDAAYQYRSNAVLRPHGHVDKGAGLQACTLVPVVGDEKVTLTMLSRVFPGVCERDVKDECFLESLRCLQLPSAQQFCERSVRSELLYGVQEQTPAYAARGPSLYAELHKSFPWLVYREYFAGTMQNVIRGRVADKEVCFEVLEERQTVMDEISKELEAEEDKNMRVPSIFCVPRLTDDLCNMKEQAEIIKQMATERMMRGVSFTTEQMQRRFRDHHMTTLANVLYGRLHMHKEYLKQVEKMMVEAYLIKNM